MEHMRKFLCTALISALMLGLCACEKAPASAAAVNSLRPGEIVAADPIYDAVAPMIKSVEALAEYDQLMQGRAEGPLDYTDLDTDDFWNIIAIALSSYDGAQDIASVDAAGVYRIKWSVAEDIAKTFMYEHWSVHFMPSYTGSYAASADPGSGIVDLAPLSVDNYDGELEYIERTSDHEGCDYILNIALYGREDSSVIHHYKVCIAEWSSYFDSVEGHIFPFMITNISLWSTERTEQPDAGQPKSSQSLRD